MAMNFPGYSGLLGPAQVMKGVDSIDDYRDLHERLVTERLGRVWKSEQPVVAYVSQGRWVARCHWCGNGVCTSPAWKIALCSDCGAAYEEGFVVFPANHAAIEAALCQRVRRIDQDWHPGMTVRDLKRENSENGEAA